MAVFHSEHDGGEDVGARPSSNGLRSIGLVLVGVLLAAIVGGVGLFVGMGMGMDDTPDQPLAVADPVAATTSAPEPEPTQEPEELDNAELAQKYGDSVFKVETAGCQVESSGTAWVLDNQHLVTNWHVVSNDPTPELVSRDGRTRLSGTVIGGHLEPDVAVIRVDDGGLPDPLPWAETDDLREGQEVVSLGYPAPRGDFAVTPSTIISFQRSGSTREAIRGDGALDRGNSGGPALTRTGEVAGVATLMVQEASQLQMVPLLFTTDALRASVDKILDDPQEVDADCDPTFGTLPDDWAPDFDDWSFGPQAYGDDASLDALYDACAAGDLGACDDLWWSSAPGSDYEAFAMTCGGRVGEGAYGNCELQAEWEQQERDREAEERRQAEADAAALAALATACRGGDMQACDDLYWAADYGSPEQAVADDCGGRYPGDGGMCVYREQNPRPSP